MRIALSRTEPSVARGDTEFQVGGVPCGPI
jgi:hypothetical protein